MSTNSGASFEPNFYLVEYTNKNSIDVIIVIWLGDRNNSDHEYRYVFLPQARSYL